MSLRRSLSRRFITTITQYSRQCSSLLSLDSCSKPLWVSPGYKVLYWGYHVIKCWNVFQNFWSYMSRDPNLAISFLSLISSDGGLQVGCIHNVWEVSYVLSVVRCTVHLTRPGHWVGLTQSRLTAQHTLGSAWGAQSHTQHSVPSTQYSVPSTQYFAHSTQYSVFSTQYLVSKVREF